MKDHFPILSSNERRWRVLGIALLPSALLLLRAVAPGRLPEWLPFATACGAITGLPCIFCGTTRAIHFLLNGNFQRALYFNWLAFPLVAGAASLTFLMATELLFGRRLLTRLPQVRLRARTVGGLIAGLFLLWGVQVYLAVSQHKQELLNPTGPLYSLVVRECAHRLVIDP